MYELWHIPSRNLLEEFATESEALDAIREYVDANNVGMLQELSLSVVPTDASEWSQALPPTLAGNALAERLGLNQRGRESGGTMVGGGAVGRAAGMSSRHGASSVRNYRGDRRVH